MDTSFLYDELIKSIISLKIEEGCFFMKKFMTLMMAGLVALSAIGCTGGQAPEEVFTQKKVMMGIKFYATAGVSEDKLNHAMNVMAEYLDNDEDGLVDNPKVHEKLIERGATMVLFKSPEESEKLAEKGIQSLGPNIDQDAIQDLYDSEIHINGAEKGEFDASYEELFHLITHVGYADVYPEVFGEKAGSKVAKSMDIARGGHFETIPKKYPETAWYSYYDETADYGTMVTEYMYWAMTSILGAQEFDGRLDQIQGEWKLNTKDKVMEKDMAIYKLLTDEAYGFPTQLPDGQYTPSK